MLPIDKWLTSGSWLKRDSSNVAGIRYYQKRKILYVEYLNKNKISVYAYHSVPESIVRAIWHTQSLGSYINSEIKPFFKCGKLN